MSLEKTIDQDNENMISSALQDTNLLDKFISERKYQLPHNNGLFQDSKCLESSNIQENINIFQQNNLKENCIDEQNKLLQKSPSQIEQKLLFLSASSNSVQTNLEEIKSLISNETSIDIECFDVKRGDTSLIQAVRNQNFQLVQYLIEQCQASIQHYNFCGLLPSCVAAYKGNLKILKYIIEKSENEKEKEKILNWETKRKDTALGLSIQYKHIDCAQYLIETNLIEIEHKDNYGDTYLMDAAKNGCEILAKNLLEKNSSKLFIEHSNKKGDNALMRACYEGHLPIVYLLIEYGADVNAVRHFDGLNCLMIAVVKKHYEIVDFLSQLPQIDFNYQLTEPLKKQNKENSLLKFSNTKNNLTLKDHVPKTVLMIAVERRDQNCVEILSRNITLMNSIKNHVESEKNILDLIEKCLNSISYDSANNPNFCKALVRILSKKSQYFQNLFSENNFKFE